MYKYIKPTVQDIKNMQQLVSNEVENGNILVRNEDEMATTIRSYTVVYQDDILAGFVALHIHSPILAEIRSLVVKKELRGQGLGKKLIQTCIDEAKDLLLEDILVLTYQQQLFEKFNFKVIDKASIPDNKIWADCVKCKHFPICDEIALLLTVKNKK
jgi:amino-acid N-acetyltransferase